MDESTHSDLPLSEITALSPIDGRYRKQTAKLATYLSEFSLIRIRLEVESSYVVALSKRNVIRELTLQERKLLETLGPDLTIDDAENIKQIEKKLKHDVKAVEVFLREKIKDTSLKDITEYIHFGITSEDVNNLSYRLMVKRAGEEVIAPAIKELLSHLLSLSEEHKDTPMLARTHGQPAVPTTLGKEFVVFASRIANEYKKLKEHTFSGKLAGAVGNYNALSVSYPKTDWIEFAEEFVKGFGFSHASSVTQINTYEDIIEYFQILQRINLILLDFDQDMWRYISDSWFVQDVQKDEVGSSTMPQKINPIHFENSEGNIGLANSMIEFFVRKLPVSRLQRDLSDSTVVRNFGSVLSYSLLAYTNTLTGLKRVQPDKEKLINALENDWSILSEAAQTILRKEGISDPYSLLKSLTRGETITEEKWKDLLSSLPISEDTMLQLETLTPKKYIGIAPEIVMKEVKRISQMLT